MAIDYSLVRALRKPSKTLASENRPYRDRATEGCNALCFDKKTIEDLGPTFSL